MAHGERNARRGACHVRKRCAAAPQAPKRAAVCVIRVAPCVDRSGSLTELPPSLIYIPSGGGSLLLRERSALQQCHFAECVAFEFYEACTAGSVRYGTPACTGTRPQGVSTTATHTCVGSETHHVRCPRPQLGLLNGVLGERCTRQARAAAGEEATAEREATMAPAQPRLIARDAANGRLQRRRVLVGLAGAASAAAAAGGAPQPASALTEREWQALVKSGKLSSPAYNVLAHQGACVCPSRPRVSPCFSCTQGGCTDALPVDNTGVGSLQ